MANLCLCLGVAASLALRAQSSAPQQKETNVSHHANGSFEVKLTPQQPEPAIADSGIGRMLSDKQFHGDLEATSKGQMLWYGDPAKGSAGYVAIEHVTGTLAGRSGSFALQHTATIDRGAQQIHVIVVPGSGTGQLAGLAGSMNIIIEGGKHSYTFDYTLPAAP
jgi:hypothetical protein